MISFQTNIDSLVAQQNLAVNSKFQSNTIQQLTSGYRINSSGDDAAGLAVANQDRDNIAQITQGVANGNDGTAQLQIMDGGMSNISQILDRLQTLATQSASSTFTGNRSDLNAEFQNDITELNRQAQAIGLNTGGTFAKSLDVYLGGGGGANAAAVSQDGQVTVDLSKSTVDAHSLGLAGMGMQVVAGTQDISSNSTTHSAYDIVTNASNLTGLSNRTTFYLSGPGFSDNSGSTGISRVKLSVDLTGVSDTTTLVTAINNAINSAVANTSAALSAGSAAALKTAGITASVNTDATGAQELAFSSNTTAFQVEAGDQMANALMGNLSTNPTTPAQGLPIATTVTGAATAAPGAFAYAGVSVQISGAGMSSPQTITFTSSQNTMGTALSYLQTQVAQNAALSTAGITVTQATPGSALIFTGATGESFSVQATGDTANALGLGSLDNSSTASSPAFYSTITGNAYSATSNGNGLATLGFSLNGGPTDGGPTTPGTPESAATITGVTTTANLDTTTGTGFGNSQLSLRVNGTQVGINFANDANNANNESWTNVAAYINSQVNKAMGWGSDVHLATVSGGNKLVLTDPYADTNSTLTVDSGTAATALGLSGSQTGTDGVGNTVTLNLAGGDATSASYTSQATNAAMTNGILTRGAGTVAFTIDGKAASADFSVDPNNVGTAAVLTGSKIGADQTATVNTAALLGAATYTPGAGMADDGNGTALVLTNDHTGGSGGALIINGTSVDISADTNLAGVAASITTTLAGNTPGANGPVTATEVVLADGSYALKLTSAYIGSGQGISITNNQAAIDVGLSTGISGSPTLASGTSQNLTVTIDGGAQKTINFSTDANKGATESLANVAAFINSSLDANGTGYNTPGLQYVDASTGALVISGVLKGSTSGHVTVGFGAAAQTLGLNSSTSSAKTVNGPDETVAQVVSWLNTAAQKALGTDTSEQIFTLSPTGNTVSINSQTKGAVSGFTLGSVTGNGTGIVSGLGLGSLTTVTSGRNASLSSVASTLTQAFSANTTLNNAGLQASASGNDLNIASANNTSFRLAEYDTTGGTTLGFTSTGGPFTAALNSGKSQATLMDAGGTSAIGTGTTANPYLSFKPMLFGSDTQALTISANNAAGVPQPLTITLRNDTGAEGASSTSGASIDSAVAYINSQLQASKNPTLQSIVAVKENVAGTEEINFLSSLSSFNVSVGSSVNGNGVNGGVAKTFGSVANGAANNSAIDTLAGAQAAVTAVTAAVAGLGTAQAAIGKGENQLSYAVNLAQSQISNISSAESQIRDANVAAEAANLTKAQVLEQSTIAAMAQANQEPQAILSLLKQ